MKPYWWQVIIILVATAAQVWSSLQLPALMADIVNEGIVKSDIGYVWGTGFIMLGYAALTAAGAFVASLFAARVGTAFSCGLREAIFKKILSFSVTEIDKFSTASLMTRTTNDINQVQMAIIMCLMMLVRAPIMCIGAIFQAIATAPDMTWIIVLAICIVLAGSITIFAIVMPKFKIFQKLVDRITLLTRENLTGLKVIRAFNNQKVERKKFEKTNKEFTHTIVFINKIMSINMPLLTFIFNGITLLCIWIGISLISTDFSYLGNMMAFMQYAIQVVMSFLFLAVLFVILPRANVSAGRINEVLNTKSKIHWKERTKGSPEKTASVEFRDVDFAYENAEEKVLNDISFVAKAGETTAFIGSTGSGKSTLINLVPRFYEATDGEILVNGINVKDYSKNDLMEKIGYVPQKGILFSGSIESNITFGAPDVTKKQVKIASRVSQSEEFIEKLDKKYKSHVAQGGNNVSGGQKQRLSIARAIAKNPDIYIFDDSFSALDMKTDAKLRKSLKEITKNSVTLIVAQRVSTIKESEQIVVLNAGRIVGKGTHYELLKSCKVYQEIAKSQLSDQEYAAEIKKSEVVHAA